MPGLDGKKSDKNGERKKAQELAERAGIPLWGAFRVVRGELSLNELLKAMLRRDRFQRLQKGGLDPDLAGHVASGSLPEWRARVLQEMRQVGRDKFTRDRVETACREKFPVAIWKFGDDDWVQGTIPKTRTYDFSFLADGAAEPQSIFKHDVKATCQPADLELVRAQRKFEKKVTKEGLGASRDRKDRYRPTDEELAKLKSDSKKVRWIFRDGTAVEGKVFAFGRWDLDIELETGSQVTIFFHAFHKVTGQRLGRVT
jgi:hypothetical protein